MCLFCCYTCVCFILKTTYCIVVSILKLSDFLEMLINLFTTMFSEFTKDWYRCGLARSPTP